MDDMGILFDNLVSYSEINHIRTISAHQYESIFMYVGKRYFNLKWNKIKIHHIICDYMYILFRVIVVVYDVYNSM